MKRRILFVDAKRGHIEIENRYPHLGFGYLASRLRQSFGADHFDLRIAKQPYAKEIGEFRPDMVCISAVSSNYGIARDIAAAAKASGSAVVIGGPHISNLPETLDSNMDAAVMYEGENTFVNLMKLYDASGALKPEELQAVKGLAFRRDGELVVTPRQEFIEDMDSIPFPARDLMDIHRHTSIFSSRGCPFQCTFCASSPYWKKVRTFSPAYIAAEIKELYERYGVRFIGIYDDLFSYNKKRVSDIIGLLRADGLLGRIKFSCHCRVGSVDEELAGLLAEMGVVSASFGIESGNDRVMQYHKGKNVSTEKARRDISTLKKKGIHVNASFIIGAPDETAAEIEDTVNFIKQPLIELFEVYLLEPWPGSRLWEYAESKGLVSKDMDWERLNVNFGTNKEGALIVSGLLSRDQLWKTFKRLQRIRLLKTALNLYKHPFLIDVPMMLVGLAKQYFTELFRKKELK